MQYQLSAKEKEDRAAADRLNAILQFSSIKGGSESAMARSDAQRQRELLAQRDAASGGELEATLGVRSREGALDRAAQSKLLEGIYGLTPPEQRDVRGQSQTFDQLDEAVELGQGVVDAGGDFKGAGDLVVGALRDWEYGGAANLLADVIYNPNEKAARAQFGSAIGNWRKNLSGSAITGIERTLGADWDPTAPGISSVEAIARARRLQAFINNNRETLGLPAMEGRRNVGAQLRAAPDARGELSQSALKYLE